jgi:hypothetical protein
VAVEADDFLGADYFLDTDDEGDATADDEGVATADDEGVATADDEGVETAVEVETAVVGFDMLAISAAPVGVVEPGVNTPPHRMLRSYYPHSTAPQRTREEVSPRRGPARLPHP